MRSFITIFVLAGIACAQNSTEEGKVVRYKLNPGEPEYTYAASYTPVVTNA